MRKIAIAFAILGATLATALYTAPAHAQATRTWVSGVGDDANPCSRTAPCKTWAGAIAKTVSGGEIDALDPGGFGAVTITKPITLDGGGGQVASVLVAGTNGITVAAGAGDTVILRNLRFQGLLCSSPQASGCTGSPGLNGVSFMSGLTLLIDTCVIQGFATNGVSITSSTANARAIIKNSTIILNGTQGTSNSGGVTVQGNGVGNIVEVIDTLLQSNLNYGLQVTGSGNAVSFLRSTANPTGIVSVSGGQLVSFGPSNVFNTGAPTQPVINFQ